jgi:hypothetical protein
VSSTKSLGGLRGSVDSGEGRARASTLADLASYPASPRSPYPIAFSVPTPTPSSMTFRIVTSVQVRHPAVGPFASAGSTSSLELLGGSALHCCSFLSHSPLPHPLHLKTFSHQDSTNEGPFALAHPVQIQGYTEFPAHALSFMVVRA